MGMPSDHGIPPLYVRILFKNSLSTFESQGVKKSRDVFLHGCRP